MPALVSDFTGPRRKVREHRLDDRLVGTGANQVGVGRPAQRHVERLQQDRLAGAGLAGEDVQAGLEPQLELLDDRQVP